MNFTTTGYVGRMALAIAIGLGTAFVMGNAGAADGKYGGSKPIPLKQVHGKKMNAPKPADPAKDHTGKVMPKNVPVKKVHAPKSPPRIKPAAKTEAAPSSHRKMSKSHAVHWGYAGAGGPENWGSLKADYKACGAGRHQSPVNIETVEPGRLAPLKFHYKVSLIEMINNGHTVQANYGKGSYIMLGDTRYDLLQFHFHTPSEHKVAGRSFPMEIHFVHRDAKGRLAVVGVLATLGADNLAAREVLDRLPSRPHRKSRHNRALINARDLLPENAQYFRYSGSLTTPPCSEKVEWMVLQTPVQYSERQIGRLHGIIGMNARPVQARNSRYLLQSTGG